MMKYTWMVEVTYDGYDNGFDRELEASVGRDSAGAGYAFTGLRDISFEFKQGPAAKRAAQKLKRRKRVNSVTLTKYDDRNWEAAEHIYLKPKRRKRK